MERADSLSRRSILRGFAWLLWIGGFLLTGWGTMWFGVHLEGQPWLKAALIRIFGTIIMADGWFAAVLAESEPATQRRGVRQFAIAHGVVLFMLHIQSISTLDGGLVDLAIGAMWSAGGVFAFLWLTADGLNKSSVVSLLSIMHPPRAPEVESYDEQIRKMAAQEERNRLARDLHDSVKQQLFAIQTAAATAQTRYGSDAAGTRAALQQVRIAARDAMAEMQALLDHLRANPLENTGLAEALRAQCEALRVRTGTDVQLEIGELPPAALLPPGAHEALYRVAQEALSNIARHARARHVSVRLNEQAGMLRLTVEDDGAGFDSSTPALGMGVRNMRARTEETGGEFELITQRGGGTKIVAGIPFIQPVRPGVYLRAGLMWLALTALWGYGMLRQPSFRLAAVFAIGIVATLRQAFAWAHARRPLT